MHAAYFRPGGVHQDLPTGLLDEINDWAKAFPDFINDMETAWKEFEPRKKFSIYKV